MTFSNPWRGVALGAGLLCLAGACGDDGAPPTQSVTPKPVRLLTTQGGRIDWSHANNTIAYDRLENGRFDIHTMDEQGNHLACLTCDAALPKAHRGQPAWHPDGRHLALQVLKESGSDLNVEYAGDPGAGIGYDIWLLDTATGAADILWELPPGRDHGVLHAHFSEDGKRFSWSELYSAPLADGYVIGKWRLMVADFGWKNGKGALSNVTSVVVGPEGFYENHGFDREGKKLIFTGNIDDPFSYAFNIYSVTLATGAVTRLATGGYNEHAIVSPDGRTIAWMSSRGIADTILEPNFATEYWLMDIDGGNKRKLTSFNTPGIEAYLPLKLSTFATPQFVPSDVSWSPDGTALVGFVQLVGKSSDLFFGTPDKWNVWVAVPEALR